MWRERCFALPVWVSLPSSAGLILATEVQRDLSAVNFACLLWQFCGSPPGSFCMSRVRWRREWQPDTVVLVTAPGLCALQCNSDPASQIVILRRSAWLIISLLSIFCAAVWIKRIIFSRNAQSQTSTHCWTCHTSPLGALFALLASFPRVDNQLEMSDRHFSALMVLLYMQRNC